MNPETKNCQNCKKDFTIESEDFAFYDKIKVPPPTWCPECRLQRRLIWQVYNKLYKRKCDFTGEDVIATHPKNSPYKIYKQEVWWSDKWDPKDYGREYDFSRPFFEQFNELMLDVPLPALNTEYSGLVDSEYCNAATNLKDCYLVFRTTGAEHSAYLSVIVDAKNVFDVSYSNFVELSYESLGLQKCSRVFYSQDCQDSYDIWFSRDLSGCSNCIGCANLRGKNYHIFNEPYTKEAYKEKLKEFNFGSFIFREEFKKRATDFTAKKPKKNFHGVKNDNVSGDYIFNSRNVRNSYMVRNGDNVRYSQLLKNGPTANCYDYSIFSDNAEWVYESCWVGLNVNHVLFSGWSYRSHDIQYCFGAMGSGNLFGCVGIRKGEYCILNKQYSKEEYMGLVSRIMKHMNDMPYTDKNGMEYKYGEFFPHALSPWKYNEGSAQEWVPLSREEALAQGFSWRDDEEKSYIESTIPIPDHIDTVTDNIIKEILKCETCGKNYRLIKKEVDFYRQHKIPVPHECPPCRDRARTRKLQPMKIYKRACNKCGRSMETSYAPERPEIVYCETCYQQEVV